MKPTSEAHVAAFDRVRQVGSEAVDHEKAVRNLLVQRRDLLRALGDEGFSQADMARELGVTRQVLQKMLAD